MIKYDLGKFYLDLFLKAPSPRDVDFLLTQMVPCHESEEENLNGGQRSLGNENTQGRKTPDKLKVTATSPVHDS